MPRELTSLELLVDRLQKAPTADPEIFCAVIAKCERVHTLRAARKASRLDQLVADHAWTDAALALIAIELPVWTVRRLVNEDGEWLYSLSQQPNLPLEIDDTVDAYHPVLPLAMLSALIDAQGRLAHIRLSHAHSVPLVRPGVDYAVCCDNFA